VSEQLSQWLDSSIMEPIMAATTTQDIPGLPVPFGLGHRFECTVPVTRTDSESEFQDEVRSLSGQKFRPRTVPWGYCASLRLPSGFAINHVVNLAVVCDQQIYLDRLTVTPATLPQALLSLSLRLLVAGLSGLGLNAPWGGWFCPLGETQQRINSQLLVCCHSTRP